MNFLGLKKSQYKDCNVLVIPYGHEKGVSYGRGTRHGPRAVIKASYQVETYHEHGRGFPEDRSEGMNIHTFTGLFSKQWQMHLPELEEIIRLGKQNGRFILTIGGDHSITPAAVKPHLEDYPDLEIVQFDAHCDLRETYENSKESHACAMRRCLEIDDNIKLHQYGIRNKSREECDYIENNTDRIQCHTTLTKYSYKGSLPTGKNIYLTFDVDAFDLSLMPATGTPEPGGLMWDETISLLYHLITENNVVAADVVEFAPIKGMHAYDFLVAKLCYKILEYKFYQSF